MYSPFIPLNIQIIIYIINFILTRKIINKFQKTDKSIQILNQNSISNLALISHAFINKTGTLTTNKSEVVELYVYKNMLFKLQKTESLI